MEKKQKLFGSIILGLSLFFCFCSCDSGTKSNETNIEGAGSDEDIYIGRGYDVFDEYANSSKVKAAVIDVDALIDDELIEEFSVENATFQECKGSTSEEYLENISADLSITGEYKKFTADVKSHFDTERYTSTSSQFASLNYYIPKKNIRIKQDVKTATLKKYLTDTFRENINNSAIAPTEIFIMYGTHCLRNVVLGGRLDYIITAETSTFSGAQNISSYAKFGYSSLFASAEIEASGITSEQWSNFSESMQSHLRVMGGKSEYGANISQAGNYDNWIGSIDTNPGLCDFGKTGNDFIPLWDFCDDETRKAELKAAYATWATEKQIVLIDSQIEIKIKSFKILESNEADGDDVLIRVRLFPKDKEDNNSAIDLFVTGANYVNLTSYQYQQTINGKTDTITYNSEYHNRQKGEIKEYTNLSYKFLPSTEFTIKVDTYEVDDSDRPYQNDWTGAQDGHWQGSKTFDVKTKELLGKINGTQTIDINRMDNTGPVQHQLSFDINIIE